jgi:flavin-binding protein dodecin
MNGLVLSLFSLAFIPKESFMSDSVFKGVEIVGTSEQSFSHAIEVAAARARRTLHNLSWFVVKEMRGGLQQGRLQYQVTLRVFFKLDAVEDASEAGDQPGKKGAKKSGRARK